MQTCQGARAVDRQVDLIGRHGLDNAGIARHSLGDGRYDHPVAKRLVESIRIVVDLLGFRRNRRGNHDLGFH